jgi:hypothetical protein
VSTYRALLASLHTKGARATIEDLAGLSTGGELSEN